MADVELDPPAGARLAAECRVLIALLNDPMTAPEILAGPLRRTAFNRATLRDELLAEMVDAGLLRVEEVIASWKGEPDPHNRTVALYRVAEGKCRVCGCTDEWGCDGGCEWVEPDLCSECVDAVKSDTGNGGR